MLKIGDTVKVIGKTLDGRGEEKELIPIGAICRIVGYYNDDKKGLTVGIRPEGDQVILENIGILPVT